MPVKSTIPRWVFFAIATGLGVWSTFQAFWLWRLSPNAEPVWPVLPRLLVLNLVYWYVPALAAPIIMRLASRYQLGTARWPVQARVHMAGAVAYAGAHSAILVVTRVLLFPNSPSAKGCWSCILSDVLWQLDWLLMTYLFFVGLAHALAYRRESERRALDAARLETRLVQAQLQALQRQLHPHFLFNTLNTISGLMRFNVNAADAMLDRLGGLLRMTLDMSGAQQITLERELELLGQYLEIEQTRLGGRLTVKMDVDPDTLDALVPNLVMQTLVENAIRHGVAPHARPGWIAVRAARAGERLTIDIRDSGNGVPEDCLTQLNQGVGLSNTRARLEHLYRDDFKFTFSNVDDGFCVTVNIPLQRETASAPDARTGVA
jgi:signal transduction histidine kinase